MSLADLKERFDSFQRDAVSALVRDFTENPLGRYLLVIPTAGGKTLTAAKAVNRLFEARVLNSSSDSVLWTAHRRELLDQARNSFRTLAQSGGDMVRYEKRVSFEMISSVPRRLTHSSDVRLVVIDEAHHGAANSYQPIFQCCSVGVLGLTATPSRHDGKPLDFERESYSIGFPDLVKKGVILRPEVHRVIGGRYEMRSLEEEGDLEQLNNKERNAKIIDELFRHSDQYGKVIIYVGTQSHVVTLYRQILNSPLKDKYESISYIIGDGNSRNQQRGDFIEKERRFTRSIVVNVHVLSEGYDDPRVNTVVMATPTRSKLYYMQAMGRAIRINLDDPLKKVYVVEVEDELPNIRYRIDNRWLYADISDALEPAVLDWEFASPAELENGLHRIYAEYRVREDKQVVPRYEDHHRYSVLLFKVYQAPGQYMHYAILIDNGNRMRVSNMFNFLSERMASFKQRQINSEAAFRMVGRDGVGLVENEVDRRCVFSAMENAVPTDEGEDRPQFVADGYPWITYVAFRYKEPGDHLSRELLDFSENMVNREHILDTIRRREFEPGSYLIRLPLPLKSYIGRIVTATELAEVDEILGRLQDVKKQQGCADHRTAVQSVLGASVLPIELSHSDSLVLIVRGNEPYKLGLE